MIEIARAGAERADDARSTCRARNGGLDESALVPALATAFDVVKRMRLEQTWIMKKLATRAAAPPSRKTRACAR